MPSEVKAPGGVAFVLPLDENKTPDVTKRPPSPPKSKSAMSLDEINAKLEEAERRRRSVETQMLEKLAEENARIQEAQAKVAEKNKIFQTEAEKALVEKMTKVEIRKQTLDEELKSKFEEKQKKIKMVQERKKEMGDSGDADPCEEEKE